MIYASRTFRIWLHPGIALMFTIDLERREHPFMLPWSCLWNDMLRAARRG